MNKLFIGSLTFLSVSAFSAISTPQANCLKAVQNAKDVGNNSQYKSFDSGIEFCSDIKLAGQAKCMELNSPLYYGLENLKEWCQDVTENEAACISFGASTTETFLSAKKKCRNLDF